MKNQRTHITRFLIIAAIALIGCYIGLTPGRTAGSSGSANKAAPLLPTLRGEAAIGHLKQSGLYHSLATAVTAARYKMEERKAGGYQASNPEQGYRTIFTREGVELRGASRTGPEWRLGMKLRSAGYGERQLTVSGGRLRSRGNRTEIEHQVRQWEISSHQLQITEWYQNTAGGLEQGFTLESAPGERREGERLRVTLALEGELRAEEVEAGQALELTDDKGQRVMRYDHLVVMDAGGRELAARMAARMDRGEVWLEVDDRDALWPVTIDPTFTQQQKLLAADAAADDLFGTSVAISGETIVVGVPGDSGAAGLFQGSTYVFVRSAGVWSQQQKLEAADPADDSFGVSVAISGETIVVGAPFDDGAAGFAQGSAYVFVRSAGVWSQQQKLEAADPASDDSFGVSVAISGETVVVGSNQGSAAYVFMRSAGVWSQQQKLEAADAAEGEGFGNSLAISGETVVVGAVFDDDAGGINQGSAYVFVRSGGVWSQQQKLLAADAAEGDGFGESVAISGETIVVGARFDSGAAGLFQGSAYIFARSVGVWSQQQKLEASDPAEFDQFGFSVAISGETVVVGTPFDSGAAGSDQGSVYVFVRSGVVWSQQQKLEAADAAAGDFFGRSVAISGETIVVGAPFDDGAASINQGSAYVFAADTCGITINPATLPQPHLAVPYLRILSATPAGNYSFSVSAGALPPGLQLVTVHGVTAIAGLPTTPGTFSFTIEAEQNGTTCVATRSYTVTIPATVVPILNCVKRNHNGTYTARFGYDNSTGAAVTIPMGPNNFFTPGNQNRGQTTVFQPGLVANAFSVTFNASGSNLAVWFLRGPDGVLRPVNVLTTSIGCQ